ncbi:hypothetical protein [Croceicoccus sediminis]|nr:hypothetical protein [Croceicoccus sediminis]
MAKRIARAVSYPLHHGGDVATNTVRFVIVAGSAVAVIMAGPFLPF